MARVSTKENKNIYQLTREGLKLSRDAASELLESIPPERIEKIENERSLPHPDEVLAISSPAYVITTVPISVPSDRSTCRKLRSKTSLRSSWRCWLR